ncbi:MAG TPA: hypothetical protein VFN10_22780 [Thermoanaerobaculia bacterium]|nr:hypothetical protein [Thermoanaerobaculia bacterium]
MKLHRLAAPLVFAALSVVPVMAQQAATITLPDLNPSEWFDGKMGGTFGAKTVTAFAKSNRVAVTGFRVVFVTHNEARAISRASYLPGGVERGTARAKMEVDLTGVDDATMQAITDRAYQTFLDQLKAAGREVVVPDAASFAAFKTVTPVPQPVDSGLLRGKAFSPSGMPLWWQVGDSWGDAGLSQKNMRAFNDQSKALGASISVAPMIVVDFAQMQSSGNRSALFQRRAEVGATLAMSVPVFYTRVVRAEQTRYGGLVTKGDDGALSLTKTIDTDVEFAELSQVDTKTGKVLSLNGADSTSKRVKNVAETTNDAYTAAASAVLGQTTGAFAKLFAQNPAK